VLIVIAAVVTMGYFLFKDTKTILAKSPPEITKGGNTKQTTNLILSAKTNSLQPDAGFHAGVFCGAIAASHLLAAGRTNVSFAEVTTVAERVKNIYNPNEVKPWNQ